MVLQPRYSMVLQHGSWFSLASLGVISGFPWRYLRASLVRASLVDASSLSTRNSTRGFRGLEILFGMRRSTGKGEKTLFYLAALGLQPPGTRHWLRL